MKVARFDVLRTTDTGEQEVLGTYTERAGVVTASALASWTSWTKVSVNTNPAASCCTPQMGGHSWRRCVSGSTHPTCAPARFGKRKSDVEDQQPVHCLGAPSRPGATSKAIANASRKEGVDRC